MENEKLVKVRDKFREIADIIDEMLELEVREKNGEDITKELESAMGRYIIKCASLQELQ